MPTSSLWAEVTISGFFLFLTIFFLILKFLNIHDLSFFSDIKDYLAIFTVGVVIISYILGILTHRLIIIALVPLVRYIERQGGRTNVIKDTELHSTSHSRMILVWQYGSERLHKELEY